jgi:hypothetical protein
LHYFSSAPNYNFFTTRRIFKCSFTFDYTLGEQHIDIEHNVYKRRLDLDGKPIEEEDPQKEHNLGVVAKVVNQTTTTNENNDTAVVAAAETVVCGSCYGSETAERKCCNTCNDVRDAYRLKTWKFDPRGVEQCRDGLSSELEERALKEGCQIYGYLEVNLVMGSNKGLKIYQTINNF